MMTIEELRAKEEELLGRKHKGLSQEDWETLKSVKRGIDAWRREVLPQLIKAHCADERNRLDSVVWDDDGKYFV